MLKVFEMMDQERKKEDKIIPLAYYLNKERFKLSNLMGENYIDR